MAVARIRPRDHRQHQRAVRDRAAHRADMFEALPTRDARVAFITAAGIERHASHRRFDAVNSRMRRRNADRSAAVAADGKRHFAARHRRAGTRAGAARRHVEIPRIARGFEHRVVAHTAVAEFRHVGLSDDDRVGLFEALDDHVVFVGYKVLVRRRAGHGPDARRADEVLDADRHACQCAHLVAAAECVLPPGAPARAPLAT